MESELLKKIILNIVVWPSAILWAWMCLLGILIFGHGAGKSGEALLMSLLCLGGLVALVFSIEGAIRYPKIRKRNAIASVIGIVLLAVGLYIGVLQGFVFITSSAFLCVGAISIIYVYYKNT